MGQRVFDVMGVQYRIVETGENLVDCEGDEVYTLADPCESVLWVWKHTPCEHRELAIAQAVSRLWQRAMIRPTDMNVQLVD